MVNEPAWLTSLVDQRMALIEQAIAANAPIVDGVTLIMTPLAERGDIPPSRWDRSCDMPACRKYCPPGKDFYTGHLTRQTRDKRMVYMTFGVCAEHKFEVDE